LKKRPPGWWWSLDRPGDVKRSIRFAAVCVAVSVVLVGAFFVLADAIVVEEVLEEYVQDASDETFKPLLRYRSVQPYGLGGDGLMPTGRSFPISADAWPASPASFFKESWRVRFMPHFSWETLVYGCVTALTLVLLWAIPAMVGIWTQIRRGLPDFARAPRTIIAASNYEAHRLIYAALLVPLVLTIEVVLRVFGTQMRLDHEMVLLLCLLAAYGLAGLGWIGPLRSDYTNQLIRSREHALRIYLMYVLLFPILLGLAIGDSVLRFTW